MATVVAYRRPGAVKRRVKQTLGWLGFYILLVIILFYTVFPFYWAIVSSLRSRRRACSRPTCSPSNPAWGNYVAVFREQPFGRNILNSLFVAISTVVLSLGLAVAASYALGRIQFRGRTLLLLTILGVSMFPQIAVLSGMFELVTWLGIYNNLLALTLSYMIFTLPFTVWVLTTFMRDLPKEIEEAAIVDGAKPFTIVTKVFLPLMGPALATTGLLGLHRRLERVPVRPDLHPVDGDAHRAGGDRPDLGRQRPRAALGQHHGGLGDRHRAADRPGADLPAAHRLRPDRRRGQGLSRAHGQEEARARSPTSPPAPPPAATCGGRVRSSTRSTRAASRTATATASATCRASRAGWSISSSSASTRSGSRPSARAR